MNIIGDLLRRYRKLNTLTQSDIVDELISFSEMFSALNIVTLSRWETETTRPGLKKRQTLLKFLFSRACFKDQACRILIKEQYGHLQKGLEKAFDHQFRHLVGNFPEFDTAEYTIQPLRDHPKKAYYYEQIIQIDKASKPDDGVYPVTPEMLAQWCGHPGSFAVVCEANGQHAGHYILLKLKSDVAEDIVHHRRPFHSFTVDDLCGPEENGTYLSYTLFTRSAKVAALLNIRHYYHLVEHMSTIDKIAIFSRREDTLLMTKNYGIHLVASGVNEKAGYKWYGLSAPLEDILFSDTVIESIF